MVDTVCAGYVRKRKPSHVYSDVVTTAHTDVNFKRDGSRDASACLITPELAREEKTAAAAVRSGHVIIFLIVVHNVIYYTNRNRVAYSGGGVSQITRQHNVYE